MIETMTEKEIERVRQVMGGLPMSQSKTKRALLRHMKEQIPDMEADLLLLESAFNMAQVLGRVEKALDDDREAIAPGVSLEDIEDILEANQGRSAQINALFKYAVAAVDEAFRYGYYAALENENVTL